MAGSWPNLFHQPVNDDQGVRQDLSLWTDPHYNHPIRSNPVPIPTADHADQNLLFDPRRKRWEADWGMNFGVRRES